MRAVVQVVSKATVTIDNNNTANIGLGLLILLGIHHKDTTQDSTWLAKTICRQKLIHLDGHKQPITQTAAEILLISQSTLHASTKKGTRPRFHRAATPHDALPPYHHFLTQLHTITSRPPQTGTFGAWMHISSTNIGPTTLLLDSHTQD